MRRLFTVVSMMLLAAMLAACPDKAPLPKTATIIYFTDKDIGTAPYPTRMLVTPAYMRIDNGNDGPGFILYDRRRQIIYSTNPKSRRTLVIKLQSDKFQSPLKLKHRVNHSSEKIPKVGNRKVDRYLLYTNDQKCLEVFAAKGLLPDAVMAMREFRMVLAGEHARVAKHMPAEMQNGCDITNNIVQPEHHLQYGFPVMTIDMNGRVRQLRDYKRNQAVKPALFQLPSGYVQFTPRDVQGG